MITPAPPPTLLAMKDACRLIKSYELALSEVVADIDRARIIAVVVAIAETLVEDISDDERAVRVGAIALLRKALDRYDRPARGLRSDE